MILDSFDNAESDLTARQLIEARNEAQTILDALAKGETSAAWQQLTLAEHASIESHATELRRIMQGDDYKAVREAIE